jgi:hypothetical protein
MFKKLSMLVALLASVFIFSGCMATKAYQEVKPSTDKALVYVYRPESAIYRGTPYYVFINGKKIGTIINNAYLPLKVKPGKTTIALREYDLLEKVVDKKSFDLNNGKTYYIRVNSGLFGAFTLEKIDSSTAQQEIKVTQFYEGSLK